MVLLLNTFTVQALIFSVIVIINTAFLCGILFYTATNARKVVLQSTKAAFTFVEDFSKLGYSETVSAPYRSARIFTANHYTTETVSFFLHVGSLSITGILFSRNTLLITPLPAPASE